MTLIDGYGTGATKDEIKAECLKHVPKEGIVDVSISGEGNSWVARVSYENLSYIIISGSDTKVDGLVGPLNMPRKNMKKAFPKLPIRPTKEEINRVKVLMTYCDDAELEERLEQEDLYGTARRNSD
jgi:hypothetical protein